MDQNMLVHLLAGGYYTLDLSAWFGDLNFFFVFNDQKSHKRMAGTVGAVLTCPLEVVKTRLQADIGPRTCQYKASHVFVNSCLNSTQTRHQNLSTPFSPSINMLSSNCNLDIKSNTNRSHFCDKQSSTKVTTRRLGLGLIMQLRWVILIGYTYTQVTMKSNISSTVKIYCSEWRLQSPFQGSFAKYDRRSTSSVKNLFLRQHFFKLWFLLL